MDYIYSFKQKFDWGFWINSNVDGQGWKKINHTEYLKKSQ